MKKRKQECSFDALKKLIEESGKSPYDYIMDCADGIFRVYLEPNASYGRKKFLMQKSLCVLKAILGDYLNVEHQNTIDVTEKKIIYAPSDTEYTFEVQRAKVTITGKDDTKNAPDEVLFLVVDSNGDVIQNNGSPITISMPVTTCQELARLLINI